MFAGKGEQNKLFDFGVITYNQEDVIIETLESIKYQVKTYGSKYLCRLIIADDCSKDHTLALCENWIDKNKDYFVTTIMLKHEENQGTVKNIISVLERIESSNFKIMDGDDVFSSRNIFELYEDISAEEIITCLPFGIDDRGCYKDVINDYSYYANLKNTDLLKMAEYQNLFVSGFVFMKKDLITPQTKAFMHNFRLLEDHSMYYEILTRTNAKIRFINEPYIFYRVRNISVSHGHIVNPVYMDDCKKMTEIMLRRAKSPYAKFYLKLKLSSYKSHFVFLQPIRYWGKIVLMYRRIMSRKNRIVFSQEDIKRELAHYERMKKSAQSFVNSLSM